MRKYTFIFVHLRVLIQHKRALDMKRSIKSFYDEENLLYTIFHSARTLILSCQGMLMICELKLNN